MTEETVQAPTQVEDHWSFRLIVLALTGAMIVGIAGMIALPLLGREIPPELSNIVMPIITALAAVLRLGKS